ncbi:hypothetical protein I4U23_019289 [Adineta vaga]|nr:hypothetical protein I4U23_019289 [Adineta vaga]
MTFQQPYNTNMNQTGLYPNAPVIDSKPLSSKISVGDLPVTCICPQCHQSITTVVESKDGVTVWGAAGILCLIGCIFGCCLIPFCVNELKDKTHYCPHCNAVVGQKKKM